MSLQKAGSDYDNAIANAIVELTDDSVAAHSMRGSGNTRHPNPDVLIRTTACDFAVEAKRSSISTGEYFYIDYEDLEQLAMCANDFTHTWLAMKFTHRELLCVEVPPREPVYGTVDNVPSSFDPCVTDAGSLRLTKPDTDKWPSARKGAPDEAVLAVMLGLPVDVDQLPHGYEEDE